MARGGGKDIVLDHPALKLEGHLSDFAARVAVEHPTAATGHARAPWSLKRGSTGGCDPLFGPTLAGRTVGLRL